MAAAANTVRPTAEIGAGLAAQAAAIEKFIRGQCSVSCARFAGTWSALRPFAAVLPSNLGAECDALTGEITKFAAVVAGLQAGRFELCAWQSAPGSFRIGVVKKGSVPHDGMGWAIVPIIVIGVAVVGVWILADLYLKSRELEAAAHVKQAELQQQMTHAIASAPADQRDQLAAALARANASAAPQDWLTRIGNALSDAGDRVGGALSSAASSWLPWALIAAVMLYASGRRAR